MQDPHSWLRSFAPAIAGGCFIGRAAETSRARDLLLAPEGSPLPVLMFHGAPGAGKSCLLAHLGQACAEAAIPWALVDLAGRHTAAQVLAQLAADLQDGFGIRFGAALRGPNGGSQETPPAELLDSFAAELTAGLQARSRERVGRAALLLDTHDALQAGAAEGAGADDGWLRDLRQRLHGQGILMVLAGRDRLRWPAAWDERDAEGRRIWLEQHLLAGLSEPEARDYLHCSAPAGDPPEALLSAILRVTNEESDACAPSRHNCSLLALCAAMVAQEHSSGGAYPSVAAFAAIRPGEAAAAELRRRLSAPTPAPG